MLRNLMDSSFQLLGVVLTNSLIIYCIITVKYLNVKTVHTNLQISYTFELFIFKDDVK